MEQCRLQVPSSSYLETWVLYFETKNSLPQINLSNHSFCFRSSPMQSCCLLFSYLLIRLMWSLGWEQRGMFALLILLSQKQDPSRNVSYNLIKMCKCVGFFLVKGGWTPLHDPSLFFLFHGCGLSFSFSFFDMPCGHAAYLLWVCIFLFFNLFF